MQIKKIFFILFTTILFFQVSFAQQQLINISLNNSSNIYAKTLLFYFPITNLIQHSYIFDYENNTFDANLSINQADIYDKPIINEVFHSDIIIRIKKIPFKTTKHQKILLPVTIRLNKTIIERNVLFTIQNNENKMSIVGTAKNIYIKDLINNNTYPKRQSWKMPIILDIKYQIK